MSFNIKYDQGRIRKYHYFMLLSIIQKNKQISRAQLAKLTQMSNTSVGKIIKELIEDELVIEVGQTEGAVGRRATILEINPKGSYIVGVNIELDIIQVAIVSLNGNVLKKVEVAFHVKETAESVLDRVTANILTMLKEMEPQVTGKVIAVGVSIPGLVSWPEGKTLMVPQFHWEDVPVKAILEESLDYVVYVDNDVNTVLLAESLFGSVSTYSNAACIYIGSGVGGALMANDVIIRGHSNTLGEIGHTTLTPDGALCDCGRFGCLQTFLCSTALEKQAEQPVHAIFKAYDAGEAWAVKIINRSKQYLGIAISNIVCMYNPEVILLSGPMVRDFPVLTQNLEAILDEYTLAPLRNTFKLKQSDIGKDSGVIGASAVVLSEFLRHSNDEI